MRQGIFKFNFNQAEDALTIPAESRHDYKCGSTTQSGRSMIEMLGVLAIIGVLSVGGIAGYSKAMMKYRINKTIEQITLIAGNIRAFWGPQKNYDGVDCTCYDGSCYGQSADDGCPIIKKAKIIPDDMITYDNTGKMTAINNAFGCRAEPYATNKSIRDDHQAFIIDYFIGDNVEVCIELLTHDWKTANIHAIEVSGRYFKTPVTIDMAVTKCFDIMASIPEYEIAEECQPYMSFIFDIDLGGNYWNPKARSSHNWQN